ncbi:helix-turn-helix domain-containing protein [Antarcticirhabdus aurantiaca]|uniref:Helix-turn-helix domain-containing protein n=1 Tax=Antarcticirhabdus aurantiaca TaxID=2606717 RepID=A0ACD4NWX5_9HYPH|nr:helix-turn-helix domain-containing protein [Jeongeuplla avenae]
MLLGLSQEDLAKDAGVSVRNLSRIEAGDADPLLSTIESVKLALEEHGIVFLGETETFGPGFRAPRALASGWTKQRATVARTREKRKNVKRKATSKQDAP